MDLFEGYVGIRMWEGRWTDDLLFTFLTLLLIIFAIMFRTHYAPFVKLLRDILFVKKRLSLFEEPVKDENPFRSFMVFQSLFLCAICLFSIGQKMNLSTIDSIVKLIAAILSLFLIILLFYAFKQIIYRTTALIFSEKESFELWKTSYRAIIGAWGVTLYLPAFWLITAAPPQTAPIVLFLSLYILSRFVIIYQTIRIFNIKKDGFLYFSLYLCGQEIAPLFFIYKGTVYLYNIIELSNLWR